ncbi:MAG: DHH family phosphoesterase [Candidatus Eiseniibacteriota bacterium]
MPYEEFRQFIDSHQEFLILSHVDPDGDAIGSSLGLHWTLQALGKTVVTANESPLPESLHFLPGSEWVRTPAQVGKVFGAVFVLDCSGLDRVGPTAARLIGPGAHVANVDHHAATDHFGDPSLVNVEASATAELIYEILESYGAPIGAETAECLYVGIASDTGAFRYQNTTPRVLRLAARLVERGAKPSATADALYGKKSEGSLRILGLALASLEKRGGGQVGALTITHEMFEKARATPEDADGIVQFAKSLNGARVGVLIQEIAPGEVRLSFRSDGTLDVNEIAGRFGGGGHRNAAGARVRGDLGSVRGAVLDALDRAVNGGHPPPRG